MGDPTCPVDAVKEPVHDDEQDDDRQKPGGGLQGEAALADGVGDRDRDEPSDHAGADGKSGAHRQRLAVAAVGTAHAGRQDRQHEDRLQPLTQDEDPAVKDDGKPAQVSGRIGRVRGTGPGVDDLPDEQTDDEKTERPPAEPLAGNTAH